MGQGWWVCQQECGRGLRNLVGVTGALQVGVEGWSNLGVAASVHDEEEVVRGGEHLFGLGVDLFGDLVDGLDDGAHEECAEERSEEDACAEDAREEPEEADVADFGGGDAELEADQSGEVGGEGGDDGVQGAVKVVAGAFAAGGAGGDNRAEAVEGLLFGCEVGGTVGFPVFRMRAEAESKLDRAAWADRTPALAWLTASMTKMA
jgi:hypothetical protein